MTNQPLSSNDLTKILIFILLILPSIFFVVGIIPALFLAFGIFMMKKSKDFSHLETAVRNYKYYVLIPIVGSILGSLGVVVFWVFRIDRFDSQDLAIGLAICSGFFTIPLLHIFLVKKLFLSPLKSHADWVAENGIFSGRNGTKKDSLDIVKSEGLRSFSVADELIKWAKLKEDGHITEQEFDDVRKKLLQKN
ncbi:MAG: SHOCT domain-containing protein [Candidatus Saccharibacteria bacterium]|nr:SHOCT domain-containing protein [Moraxellaceae bacterium]